MLNKTLEKYERVQNRVKAGETVVAACKAEHMGIANYYLIKKKNKKSGPKRKYTKRAPNFLDIPLQAASAPSDKVMIVICTKQQIKSVMEELT